MLTAEVCSLNVKQHYYNTVCGCFYLYNVFLCNLKQSEWLCVFHLDYTMKITYIWLSCRHKQENRGLDMFFSSFIWCMAHANTDLLMDVYSYYCLFACLSVLGRVMDISLAVCQGHWFLNVKLIFSSQYVGFIWSSCCQLQYQWNLIWQLLVIRLRMLQLA